MCHCVRSNLSALGLAARLPWHVTRDPPRSPRDARYRRLRCANSRIKALLRPPHGKAVSELLYASGFQPRSPADFDTLELRQAQPLAARYVYFRLLLAQHARAQPIESPLDEDGNEAAAR